MASVEPIDVQAIPSMHVMIAPDHLDEPMSRQGTVTSDGMGSRQQSHFHNVGIKVSWNDIEYSVEGKPILRGLTGSAFPGRTLAVMGGSGAGKTTLLNAIGDRLLQDATHVQTGAVLLNEVKYKPEYKRCIAFVTQDDIVTPMATPAEALFFSARIRKGISVEHARRNVEDTLEELGLVKCRDTIVGIPGIMQGLSGGEKKRTNIGVELITRPKVMILDEPTSGLDSISSLRLVTQLRELASKNFRTIIYSIHQPTAEMLDQFDDLLLMIHGKAIYHGPTEDALGYFAKAGFECPPTHTPTDYYMTLMQDESLKDNLIELWEKHLLQPASPSALRVLEDTSPRALETITTLKEYASSHGASYWIQFVELFRRAWAQTFRNRVGVIALFSQGIVFGLIAGLIYINIGHNVQGLQDLSGLMFMVITNKCFSGAMGVVNTFPKERAVFIREQQAGAYSPILYFLATVLAPVPIHTAATMIEAIIIYFLADLSHRALQFFTYYFAMLFTFEVSVGIGLAVSAAMDNYMVAAASTPLIIVPMMFGGGLLGSVDRLDPYWVWLKHASLCRYGWVIGMKNQLNTVDSITCDVTKFSPSYCARQPQNGTAAIASLGLDNSEDEPWVHWTQLAVMDAIVYIIAMFMLYRAAKRRF